MNLLHACANILKISGLMLMFIGGVMLAILLDHTLNPPHATVPLPVQPPRVYKEFHFSMTNAAFVWTNLDGRVETNYMVVHVSGGGYNQ